MWETINNSLNKLKESIKKFFSKGKKGKGEKTNEENENIIDEVAEETSELKEELKEAKEEMKEEIKEVVDKIKEKFVIENGPFVEKYGKNASQEQLKLYDTMDEVLKTGEAQEFNFKNKLSLIIEQNEKGNIDIFSAKSPDVPLISFDDNLEVKNPNMLNVLKEINDFLISTLLEKSGLDKLIDDASKETNDEISQQAPGTKEMNQLLNSLQEMMNPEQQQK